MVRLEAIDLFLDQHPEAVRNDSSRAGPDPDTIRRRAR